jgi:glycosyltransferase involved in cell wall biosynthesis
MQKTNFPFEIVIGEDCSTDGTREIVMEYADKYPESIKIITSSYNVGMIENGLRTMKSCEGKYITFLEGDDFWTDNLKLQKQIDFLETNSDYGLVYTNYIINSRDNSVKSILYKKQMPNGYILADIIHGHFPRILTVCCRNSFFDKEFHEFMDDKMLMGDYPIFLYLANKTKFKYFPDATAQYNYNNESITKKSHYYDRLQFFESGYNILEKFLTLYPQDNIEIINSISESRHFRLKIIFYYNVKLNKKYNALNCIEKIKANKYKDKYLFAFYKLILTLPKSCYIISTMRNISIANRHFLSILQSAIKLDKGNIINKIKIFSLEREKYKERISVSRHFANKQ